MAGAGRVSWAARARFRRGQRLFSRRQSPQSRLMLAPQFTLRRLLIWVAVAAVVCLIAGAGARGGLWAVAILVALAGLALALAVYAALYGAIRSLVLLRDGLLANRFGEEAVRSWRRWRDDLPDASTALSSEELASIEEVAEWARKLNFR